MQVKEVLPCCCMDSIFIASEGVKMMLNYVFVYYFSTQSIVNVLLTSGHLVVSVDTDFIVKTTNAPYQIRALC